VSSEGLHGHFFVCFFYDSTSPYPIRGGLFGYHLFSFFLSFGVWLYPTIAQSNKRAKQSPPPPTDQPHPPPPFRPSLSLSLSITPNPFLDNNGIALRRMLLSFTA